MLITFENYFSNADPDILLGHELLNSVLEFIIKRSNTLCQDLSYFSRLTSENKYKKHN